MTNWYFDQSSQLHHPEGYAENSKLISQVRLWLGDDCLVPRSQIDGRK